MIERDAEFALAWAPPRYPGRMDGGSGSWRIVLEDEVPVAVVWVQEVPRPGAGITWVRQTKSVDLIRYHFDYSVAMGVKELDAYNTVPMLDGVTLGRESHGALDGIDALLDSFDEDPE